MATYPKSSGLSQRGNHVGVRRAGRGGTSEVFQKNQEFVGGDEVGEYDIPSGV